MINIKVIKDMFDGMVGDTISTLECEMKFLSL